MKDETPRKEKVPIKSPEKAADKKYTEIKVLNDDGTVKRTIKIPAKGITYGQYKELSKKDPASLTDSEKKQLKDAQEQLEIEGQSSIGNRRTVLYRCYFMEIEGQSSIGVILWQFGLCLNHAITKYDQKIR